MDDRMMLMRKRAAACFSMWETHLYLNTHPNDTQALQMLRQYEATCDKLTQEYESKYGPISASSADMGCRWSWLTDPWPWDYDKGDC
ncbi:spore coat protein CotJB [Solibaculum mannosilyticum]|uniref:Spore coat protein CotJB n=1 Tax=Solibaculum mannosilyticum TaxID=2780922 RepID=A0A7I8D2X5_9FIRM|nr:spore coat protein CotJB [Solibaculum mannosilyticum]MCO7136900.1 spore coat protein CotJB [[Clostridium] leptum]BCI59809.1 spore coat protein CotJB [Solibaculum mannosilyticum]CZT56461.1 CotJB protein [Eubacteriaceae bacterium CHKCI005]